MTALSLRLLSAAALAALIAGPALAQTNPSPTYVAPTFTSPPIFSSQTGLIVGAGAGASTVILPGTGVAAALAIAVNGASGIVVESAGALILGPFGLAHLTESATAPTFTSGACTGAIGTTNGTAAFTFTTGSSSCGSTATIGLPAATTGWICDAFDMAVVGTARIQETSNTTTSVVFTNYSIGSSPGATNFSTTHTVNVKCVAY
jgi:hypothetical protein